MGDKIIVKHYFCDPENPFLHLISIKNLPKLRNSNHLIKSNYFKLHNYLLFSQVLINLFLLYKMDFLIERLDKNNKTFISSFFTNSAAKKKILIVETFHRVQIVEHIEVFEIIETIDAANNVIDVASVIIN